MLEPDERRLESRLLQHDRADDGAHLFQDRGVGAEVAHQLKALATTLQGRTDEALVGGEVGIPPAEDGLLRVSDQEEAGPFRVRALQGHQAHDLALQRVRVLELVDEQLPDPEPLAPAQRGAGCEQLVGPRQEVGEGEDTASRCPSFALRQQGGERPPRGVQAAWVHPRQMAKQRAQVRRRGREGLSVGFEDRALALRVVTLAPRAELAEVVAPSVLELAGQPREAVRIARRGRDEGPSAVDRLGDLDGLVARRDPPEVATAGCQEDLRERGEPAADG